MDGATLQASQRTTRRNEVMIGRDAEIRGAAGWGAASGARGGTLQRPRCRVPRALLDHYLFSLMGASAARQRLGATARVPCAERHREP